MALTALALGLAVAFGYLRGGRLGHIADARLGWSWLLFAGLAIQLGVDAAAVRLGLAGVGAYLLLLASQLLVAGWVVVNRSRPGMALILAGLVLNAVVIGANGAMPVDPEAIRALGIGDVAVAPGKHELMTPATRLAWLGDVFALPPLRTIVSIGDVVLAAGLVPLVRELMTRRASASNRHQDDAPSV